MRETSLARPAWTPDVITWQAPPSAPAVTDDQVHLWRAWLDVPEAVLAGLRSTLALDEKARAARMRHQQDRDRYVAARGALRAILARYLDIEPCRVLFEYNTHGKPSVKQPPIRNVAPAEGTREASIRDTSTRDAGILSVRPTEGWHTEGSAVEGRPATLSFNLSHSHDLALYAIAGTRAVGVDVELVRPEIAIQHIPEHFFSRSEVAALRSLPLDEQPLAFCQFWTCKEAAAKARGEGLTLSLDHIEVSVEPDTPPRLLRVTGSADEAARWSLYNFVPAPGYVAALAVEGHDWRLAAWDWTW